MATSFAHTRSSDDDVATISWANGGVTDKLTSVVALEENPYPAAKQAPSGSHDT